jgi:hypothetical protein
MLVTLARDGRFTEAILDRQVGLALPLDVIAATASNFSALNRVYVP